MSDFQQNMYIKIWLVIGAILIISLPYIPSFFWLLLFPFIIIWYLAGLGWLAWLCSILRKQKEKKLALKYMVLVFLAILLAWPLYKLSHNISNQAKLYLNLDQYSSIIQSIINSDTQIPEIKDRNDIFIDEGPPKRVAFVWDGVGDNWCGLVYDPTDQVLMVNSLKEQEDTTDSGFNPEITKLFGGDMLNCQALYRAHYYHCCFT